MSVFTRNILVTLALLPFIILGREMYCPLLHHYCVLFWPAAHLPVLIQRKSCRIWLLAPPLVCRPVLESTQAVLPLHHDAGHAVPWTVSDSDYCWLSLSDSKIQCLSSLAADRSCSFQCNAVGNDDILVPHLHSFWSCFSFDWGLKYRKETLCQ